jgi:hypothetical protein
VQESRAMVDCDSQRKIRSCPPQRACSQFCTLDIEIEKHKHLDVRSDRGSRLAPRAPRGFCLAAVRLPLAKKDVCLSIPLAPHRDRGVRGSQAARDRDLDAQKPAIGPPSVMPMPHAADHPDVSEPQIDLSFPMFVARQDL